MDSRGPFAVAFAAAALFACGAAAAVAGGHAFYATCAVLGLVAGWIGLAAAWGDRRRLPASPPTPPTALEAAEGELRVLANLLDQAPAPMLTLHADGSVRAINRAARRLFAAEDRLVDPPPALLDAFAPGPRHAQRLTVDLGAAARPQTYAMSVTDFVGPRGVRRLAVLLDIQPELHAAEAAALRELMGVLNHEIMNGLTPIASLASTAADLLAAPDATAIAEARKAVATLARRSAGLSRFVAAYRELAHLPSPSRRPVSLIALLDEAASLFRARWARADVTLNISPPSPDVICALDEELVVRALTNMLTNAAEAALASGAAAPAVTLAAHAEAGGVALTVQDNGAGVAEIDWERVFQPFYTTKSTGAGLGLSLTQQIARSHGGDVRIARNAAENIYFKMTIR